MPQSWLRVSRRSKSSSVYISNLVCIPLPLYQLLLDEAQMVSFATPSKLCSGKEMDLVF